MPWQSGDRLVPARLNRMQPRPYRIVQSAILNPITITEQDLPGASITITTLTAGAVWTAQGVFDFEAITAGVTVMQGRLSVDGVTQVAEAHLDGSQNSDVRTSPSQTWDGVLATAGSHTFKLRALKTNNVGVMVSNPTHTTLLVTIYEVV